MIQGGSSRAGLGLLSMGRVPILAGGQRGRDPGHRIDPGGHWQLPRDGLMWGWGDWFATGDTGREQWMDQYETEEMDWRWTDLGLDQSGTGKTGLALGWAGLGLE